MGSTTIRHPARNLLPLLAASLLLAACNDDPRPVAAPDRVAGSTDAAGRAAAAGPPAHVAPGRERGRAVTLAFAGDVHFQLNLSGLLRTPRAALGPISQALGGADVAMVNLETAITDGGTRDAKELEAPQQRFWYRATPVALDVLAAAGVDVATMANNHAADYGPVGLRNTLIAKRSAPVAVVGIGRDRRAAFAPHRVSVHGTRLAFIGADASPREGSSGVWAAGRTNAGVAAARGPRPAALLAAVRAADRKNDVVVVYMHWGVERRSCPTAGQQTTARALVAAGADVVVGSHAHVLQGAGWLGSGYVAYGLGNFLWYHDHEPETGVLRLTVRDSGVVADRFVPARTHTFGPPLPLHGADRTTAVTDWRRLLACAALSERPDDVPLPAYSWSVRRISPSIAHRMTGSSHRPGCPLPQASLRYVRMTYVGFDGRAHDGEMVIHKAHARSVASVFRRLYAARWPIRRMRLVDDYGGSDGRSMTANNTSGFNCRKVAGSAAWSAHARGAAIDIDPVQNPDLTGPRTAPGSGRRYADVERSGRVPPAPGVITADGVVVRAFARIGWEWGGRWSSGKDYQHFTAPQRSRAVDSESGPGPR